jgi:hypothetical protein
MATTVRLFMWIDVHTRRQDVKAIHTEIHTGPAGSSFAGTPQEASIGTPHLIAQQIALAEADGPGSG